MSIGVDISAICPNKQVIVQRVVKSNSQNEYVLLDIVKDASLPDNETLDVNFALCSQDKENKHYITLNMTNIEKIWNQSWLRDSVPIEVYEVAFLLHELAHVKYTNFDSPITTSTAFKAEVLNILEDARIEYWMSYDFPETSIFFNVLLSSIQTAFKIKEDGLFEKREASKSQKLLNETFEFVRYNLINKKADKSFISNVVPLALLSRRGSSDDCDIASEIIANLIKQEVHNESDGEDIPASSIGAEVSAITDEMREAKQKENEGAMKEIADKFFDEGNIKEQLKEKLSSGNEASSVVKVENKERTSFFLEVANAHAKEIEALRNIFNRAFTEFKNIKAKDGDLNFMRQQEAYMNSITGEEGNDYQYRKKEKVLVDVVLLRDISGSIGSNRTDYAKSVVILLSALENIQGIRTAQIDFNGAHFVNKTFDSGIEKAEINPVSSGGTSIRGAYNEVLRYNFKGRKNFVVVVSDGSFVESQTEVEALETKIRERALIAKFAIGGYTSPGYKSITIQDMPKEIANVIIKEGLIC